MRIIRICTSIISPLLGLDLEGQMTDNMASLTRRHSMSNYTPKMLDAMNALAPLDNDAVNDLADNNDLFVSVNANSIRSKAVRLGIYQAASGNIAKGKADTGMTKQAMVNAIRASLSLPDRAGDLVKADIDAIFARLCK